MSNWIEQLRGFSSAIRTGADAPAGMRGGMGYSLERGVEVYRNNYRGNLHDALAGAYPVLRQLVGEAFFRRLAKSFIEQHPSRSGNLHDYGGEMNRFLQQFEPVQHLPYLPDMASLEWAWHRAYFAEDVPTFEVQRLSSLAPDSYAHLRWQQQPGSALLVSAYPLSLIWQAHQPGEPEELHIDLDAGGEQLLVLRNQTEVEIHRLEAAAYHWLSGLQQGQGMGAATEATLAAHEDFDLTSSLRHWLALGVLSDFTISQDTEQR